MKIEICKTENGYHVKDKDGGDWCFEDTGSLMTWLKKFLPCEINSEIKITD
jgi:hypothetical protein